MGWPFTKGVAKILYITSVFAVLHAFESRLTVSAEMDALLAAQAAHWSWGLRKAWVLIPAAVDRVPDGCGTEEARLHQCSGQLDAHVRRDEARKARRAQEIRA